MKKSSARRVYSQSHDPKIGIIPADVTDDADDEGGISESSDVCRQTTDPMSHTPVSQKCYASYLTVSSTISMVDPVMYKNGVWHWLACEDQVYREAKGK